jgi:hypothetical protein
LLRTRCRRVCARRHVVMAMDDDERDRIMAEARSHIAKFHAGNLEPVVEDEPRQVDLPPIAVEDRLGAWRTWHAEREADRERARANLRRSEQKMIDAAHAATAPADPTGFSERQEKILGMVVSELRAEIQTAIGELRAEFNVMRSIDKGDVIDLPALPLRRRSDAA